MREVSYAELKRKKTGKNGEILAKNLPIGRTL